jgi:AcrR family transcriptional regulator
MAPDRAPQSTEPLFPAVGGNPRGLDRDQVGHNQRRRLEAAMVEAVSHHGYAETTLRELVGLAGVSKTTFYEHFDSKQECFFATFDEITSQVTRRVSVAYREEGDFRERLVAGLTTFMNLTVNEPEAAKLIAVESLALGAAGVAHRERSAAALELMIGESFEHSPDEHEVAPTTIRAIACGIRGVVYRHLRRGEVAELPDLVEPLVDWALEYQRPDGEEVKLAAAAAAESRDSDVESPQMDWKEPPASPRSRAELTQRERIIRAVGQLVVEKGYETLSIPAISAQAGTSNQTFYENFANKREAFLAAFDASTAETLGTTAAAFESAGDRPEAIGTAVRAILEHISANELFARLAFFDLQTAGPIALDRADAAIEDFTAFLRPGIAPNGIDKPTPEAVLQAVGCGAWSVIQHQLALGNAKSLPRLAPELVRVALTPFATR